MANDLNQCNFIGRLGRDPEIRHSANGNPIANFSIACGHKYKDEETTEWVRCVVFGKLAEIAEQYLRKGKQVFVSGRMQTRKWQGNDGQDKYTTEIVVENFQMIGPREDSGSRPAQSSGFRDSQPARQQSKPAQAPEQAEAFHDDDIPF